MPEFKETAEDLNTGDSVQVDVNPPLTNTELAEIRAYADGADHPMDSDDPGRNVARWLLDENARLNTALDEVHELWGAAEQGRERADRQIRVHLDVARAAERERDAAFAVARGASENLGKIQRVLADRDRTVEVLTERVAEFKRDLNRVIREAAADKAKLAAKLAEAEAQIEASRRVDKGEPCPECGGTVSPFRDAWGREAFKACTSCSWPLPGPDGTPRAAPSMPVPAPQPLAHAPGALPESSDRGTGGLKTPEAAQVIEFENADGLSFDTEHPLFGADAETEYLGETDGVHRWRILNPWPGIQSLTFPALPDGSDLLGSVADDEEGA
jgi:hypothetical protein